ncbi:ABC-three component system middle component 2 [Pseudomonas sp. Leaf129]|uniref:ABC-three component system middle component 2 n=1 Tax=Pseudomonas sp. Leaf129 TaxID=1736268 RepID=UPI00191C6368|nr:ABC-three component system middle component 2 [Pseudomonas sp. Leaf129]
MTAHPESTLIRPFNSPLECGLRMLFVLDASAGQASDLQRLISYDYLLVHSGDVVGGPESLHPAVPFRGGELLIKRNLVYAGLNQMYSRELLLKTFDVTGILYQATALTSAFLKLMRTSYAQALRQRSSWIVEHFGMFSDSELGQYMSENVGRWGGEFEQLSVLNELEL